MLYRRGIDGIPCPSFDEPDPQNEFGLDDSREFGPRLSDLYAYLLLQLTGESLDGCFPALNVAARQVPDIGDTTDGPPRGGTTTRGRPAPTVRPPLHAGLMGWQARRSPQDSATALVASGRTTNDGAAGGKTRTGARCRGGVDAQPRVARHSLGTNAKARPGAPVPPSTFSGAKQNQAPRGGRAARFVSPSTNTAPADSPATWTGTPS